jgi:hypothetical protein
MKALQTLTCPFANALMMRFYLTNTSFGEVFKVTLEVVIMVVWMLVTIMTIVVITMMMMLGIR